MSHYLTQPEEVEFVLSTMEKPGVEQDPAAQLDCGRRYGSADQGIPYARQPDPRGKGAGLV